MAKVGSSKPKKTNNLIYVKQFLQHGTFPRDCPKYDKRAVRKRAQLFVLIKDQLYYTGGRPKREAYERENEDTPKNPDNESGGTKQLRKCCITEEEQNEAVLRCHIGEDGTHFGMDKTTESISNQYYWVGITNTVRKILRNCAECVARGIRGPTVPSNYSVMLNKSESAVVEEQDTTSEPDVFFMAQEISSTFWQKVEVQVFGPFAGSGIKKHYVAVALDTFSQFPEAAVLDTLNSTSLTSFILNLICRYGVMEKLCLLQNQSAKDIHLQLCMQGLELADISPKLLAQYTNPADMRWRRIEKSLERFVKTYPKMWDRCLEVFLLPLRIALPPEADYAPVYIAHGREPVLPLKVSHRIPGSTYSELRLTENSEKESVEAMMAAYSVIMKSKASQKSELAKDGLELLPVVKLEMLSKAGGSVTREDDDTGPSEGATIQSEAAQPPALMLRNKKQKASGRKRAAPSTDEEDLDDLGDASDFDDDGDETYSPHGGNKKKLATFSTRFSRRKRFPTFKARQREQENKVPEQTEPESSQPISSQPASSQPASLQPASSQPLPQAPEEENTAPQANEEEKPAPVVVKRGRGRPRKYPLDPDGENAQYPSLSPDGKINSVEVLGLDTYYLVIKQYKERGVYPPLVSVIFKRAVRRICDTIELKDGKLYGKVGNASGKLIITNERERFSLLRKAHVRGEEHVGRVRTLKYTNDMNIFWKGMSLDIDAFLHACPECVLHNPMRLKNVVKIPSKSKVLQEEPVDNDPHMSEDEEEDSSYEDLIQYLTDGTFPATVSEEQQQRIKLRSLSFCIIKGSLYYKPSSRPHASPRMVLFAERLRQEALRDAHIEDEEHLSPQDTQAKLRKNFFWSGMTYDTIRYIFNCCMGETFASQPIPHKTPAIQERVEKFHKYFLEGIPDVLQDSKETTSRTQAESQEPETISLEQATAELLGPENQPDPLQGPILESDEAAAQPAQRTATVVSGTSAKEVSKEDAHDAVADSRAKREEETLRKTMEAIVAKMSKESGVQITKPAAPAKTKLPLAMQKPTIQQRSDKGNTRHKCNYCGRVVKGETAYKVHLYKHTGVKPFSCNTCGKMFSNKKSLRIHMRKHLGVRPYLCNQCGRDFCRSASLRYHLKAHARGQGTPVSCDICSRTFSTEHRLKRHKEFKHPAVAKVFMCNQCGRFFTAARSLKRHEQTHTGIRKYHCQYCSKSFFRKEYLNSHLTNHPEWDPSQEKQKPRNRKTKKPQTKENAVVTKIIVSTPSGESTPSNVIHWADALTEQAVSHISQSSVIDVDTHSSPERSAASSTHSRPATHSLTLGRQHFVIANSTANTHGIHPTLAHTARLMSVGGPHGPMALVSAGGQPIEVVHTSHGPDILLQHESVPVQYEVECLSGEGSSLTDADLNAIHMLAQASLTGQNVMH